MWISDRINGDREGPLARYEDFNGNCIQRDSIEKGKKGQEKDESMENFS